MNQGAPHQNGRIMRLLKEEHGGEWFQNNSIIVNRACDKWLQGRGLSTDRYNLNFGTLYKNKSNLTPNDQNHEG
jgi:hypothetical protein